MARLVRNRLCSPLTFAEGKRASSSELRPPPHTSVKCASGTGRTAATRNSVFEQWYCKLTISMMFLEKMGRFFSIFPVISASKPMKMAKTEFPEFDMILVDTNIKPVRKRSYRTGLLS